MADKQLPPEDVIVHERATAITALQIEAALRLNMKYLAGEDLKHVDAIVQALAINFRTVKAGH